MAGIFISYSRKDQAFVRQLHGVLIAENHDVWVDWEDIPLTAEWLAEIYDGIEKADTFISVLSPEYLTSENCNKEVAHAVKNNKRLVPIVRRDVDAKSVPKSLADLNWIFFRETEDFNAKFGDLNNAINTDLDWTRQHTRLQVRGLEWDRKKRDDSLLLRGKDLREAEEWLAQAASIEQPKPTPEESQYILASRKSATRRQRIVVGAIFTALVVTIVLAFIALIQRNDAIEKQNIATSRELASTALAQLQIDPELSVLIARQAVNVVSTSQAEDALRQALSESHIHAVLGGHAQEETLAAFSPDNQYVVTSSFDSTSVMGIGDTTLWTWETATGKQLTPLRGHDKFVTSAMFSHDGKWIVTSSHDGTARVWNAQTGESSAVLRGHRSTVTRAAFSPDDRYVVTAGADQTLRIWEWGTNARNPVVTFTEPSIINYTEFSPDGSLVVAAMEDGTVHVWQWQSDSRMPTATQKHKSGVTVARFDSKGTRVVSASKDKTARVLDVKTNKLSAELVGHSGAVLDANFDTDGKRVVTASEDQTARVWDIGGKEPIVLVGHIGKVNSASFSPNGRFVVTAGADATARIWAIGPREQASVFHGHRSGVSSAVYSKDGMYVLTAATDSTVRIWDANPNKAIWESEGTKSTSATFSPDGRLVAVGNVDGSVRVWNVSDQKLQATFAKHSKPITSIAFSPDSKLIVTASTDKTARVWDASTGAEQIAFTKHAQTINSAAFSVDGNLVVTASDDKTVRVWDAKTGDEKFALTQDDQVLNAMFSPNGEFLLTERHFLYRTATVYQFKPLPQVGTLKMITETDGILNAVFSPNSQFIAAVGFDPGTAGFEGSLVLLNTTSWKNSTALSDFRDLAQSVTFSSDSQRIVTAGNDGTARIWEIQTGKLMAILRGHTGGLRRARFTADNRFVVTASGDGTARVWDAATSKQLVALRDHTGGVTDAMFTPDAKTILTTSVDGKARLFACEVCGSIEKLKSMAQRVTRQLTCAERETYLHEDVACLTATPKQ